MLGAAAAAPLIISCRPEETSTVSSKQDPQTSVAVSYRLSVSVTDATSTFSGQSVIRIRYIDASGSF